MARRPVIGITAALEPAGWGVWADVEANLSPRTLLARTSPTRGRSP